MPAKKNTHLHHERISQLLHRINQIESLKSEMSSMLDLGKMDRPLQISLESFIEFNFEVSQDLESFIEEKMLDEYQKEWDEWGTGDLEKGDPAWDRSRWANSLDQPRRPR